MAATWLSTLSSTLTLPNEFTPRAYQRKYMEYFDRGGKRAVWIVHRRGGKDLTALHQTAKMAMQRVGNYWHVFPTFKQARKAIWQGITKDGRRILPWAFPPEIVEKPNEQEMLLHLKNGSTWQLIGSDNIEVVGAGPVGVVFSEYALSKPSTWDLIRPMLRENEGWAAFITTPRGDNHAREIYDTARKEPGWFHDLKTLRDTAAYGDPEQIMAEERASGMPEALIRQEYLCDWTAANVGSVFGDLLPESEEFEHPGDGVYTSFDLGVSDATAIWFWRLNGEGVDFIDHYEANGKPASHFIDLVESKPYQYMRHYLPHDARNRTWVTGATALDTLDARWNGKVEVLPQDSLANGIEAGRWLLQRQTRFHSRCGAGVKALRAYHYEWDLDRKTLARLPSHDWSSHSADAFRYAASVVKFTGIVDAPRPKEEEKQPMMVITDDDGRQHINRTFNDLAKLTIRNRKDGRKHI